MPEQNLIDPTNVADVEAALIANPRLRQFLAALHSDVGRSVRGMLERYPQPRFAALGAYKEGEYNVQLMAAQVAKDARVACRAGCWFCCTKPVQVTAPEVLIVADAVEDWPEGARETILRNARAYMQAMTGKAQKRWVYQRHRCPLLGEDGNCTVYEQRPLICRAWTSTDRGVCEAGYKSRWSTGQFQMIFEYMTVVQTVAEELRVNLKDHTGTLEHYVLAPALLIALTTENALDRWLGGDDLFASAKWTM